MTNTRTLHTARPPSATPGPCVRKAPRRGSGTWRRPRPRPRGRRVAPRRRRRPRKPGSCRTTSCAAPAAAAPEKAREPMYERFPCVFRASTPEGSTSEPAPWGARRDLRAHSNVLRNLFLGKYFWRAGMSSSTLPQHIPLPGESQRPSDHLAECTPFNGKRSSAVPRMAVRPIAQRIHRKTRGRGRRERGRDGDLKGAQAPYLACRTNLRETQAPYLARRKTSKLAMPPTIVRHETHMAKDTHIVFPAASMMCNMLGWLDAAGRFR